MAKAQQPAPPPKDHVAWKQVTHWKAVCRNNHEWQPEQEDNLKTPPPRPTACPRCGDPRWDRPKLWSRPKKKS